MTFNIIFSPKARKQIKNLENEMQIRVISALDKIRIRPEKFVKKLVGDKGYRLRVGKYRIIMDIDRGQLKILILTVDLRGKVYKRI